MRWRDLPTVNGAPVPAGSKYAHLKVGGYEPDPVYSGTEAAQAVSYALESDPPTGEGTVNVVLARMDYLTDDVKWLTWLAAFKKEFPDASLYKWYWEFHMSEGLYDF